MPALPSLEEEQRTLLHLFSVFRHFVVCTAPLGGDARLLLARAPIFLRNGHTDDALLWRFVCILKAWTLYLRFV